MARLFPCRTLLWLCVPAKAIVAQAVLTGTVRDDSTSRAITQAEVVIEALGRRSLTDSGGRYFIMNVPVGQHLALVRSVGYHPKQLAILVKDAQTVRTDARLVRSPMRLESVVVTARPGPLQFGSGLEGLEERRRRGFGRFLDSTALRRSEHFALTSLLSRAGVEIRAGKAIGRRNCPMEVYLDRVRQREPPRLDIYSVSSLAGVEVYSSVAQIPAEYDALNQICGVLLLWTRR